jgi:hypothetical protein
MPASCLEIAGLRALGVYGDTLFSFYNHSCCHAKNRARLKLAAANPWSIAVSDNG